MNNSLEESKSSESVQSMQDLLDQFVECNTENYPQRSADWYRVRKFSFGGSELGNLMGLSKKSYMSQDEFFKNKFEAVNGTGRHIDAQHQIIMDWGTLFEPVHRMALERLLDTPIQEASMCRGKGILLGCHQSPDGLAVVQTSKFLEHVYTSEVVDKTVFNKDTLTVLFEQKSPYMRKILPHTIPDYYIGQIKLGLSMFTPCDIALYSESLFRICTCLQWQRATYNPNILIQKTPTVPDPEPQFVGMCVFDEVGKAAMGIDSGDLSGIMTRAHFQKMMDLIRANNVHFDTHLYRFTQLDEAKSQAKKLAREGKAYFCWKLVNMEHTAVEKSQGFENLIAMYVNLASRALIKFSEEGTTPEKELRVVKEFTSHVKKLGVPLVPGNRQDAWYLRYERELIDLYQNYLLDDWQSIYVLMTLLSRSQNKELRDRAIEYQQKINEACQDDPVKKDLVRRLFADLGMQDINTCS